MSTSPKTFVDNMSEGLFKALCSFGDNEPDFYRFLAEPCTDPNTVEYLKQKLRSRFKSLPKEYTDSASAIHYLVVAVNNRASGNG